MLLSLANAVLLIFTLLWGVLGLTELNKFLKLYQNVKVKLNDQKMQNTNIFNRLHFCLAVNITYLFILSGQIGYVLYYWNEINL